jgi:Spy/CpxP family protein refolding chaperone
MFPPELVMAHQREIGLRDEQRRAITQAIRETQAKDVALRWEITDAHAELIEEVEAPRVDAKAALALAEKMIGNETRIKLAHLALLIRIKNTLDPEQHSRLQAFRAAQQPGPR